MIRGLGIDAVEIDRIRRVLRRSGPAFERRLLSGAESRLLAVSTRPEQFVAGRFAAKEAVMKVLGTGWGRGVRFRDVEVLADPDGVPLVHLSGAAAERARMLGIRQLLVSITHTRELALATAAGEGP